MNSVAENSETWFVISDQWKYFYFSAIITFCNILQLCTDSRSHAVSGEEPKAESPQTKRRKQEEQDLRFLQVKNKDGQDCLFVDLGKSNHKFCQSFLLLHQILLNLSWYIQYLLYIAYFLKPCQCLSFEYVLMFIIYENRSLHQKQKFPPLQVIKSGKERCIHSGRRQQVYCQTWEGNFCRGKCILGFLSL